MSRPVIDDLAMQGFREALGDALPALIAECVSDVDAACSRLTAAVSVSDGASAKRAAHTLAGVLGQFACPRAACVARIVAESPEKDALDAAKALQELAKSSVGELARRSL